ncbi:thioredoxin family protein [Enterococcus raffinosus]|uniref:thioredoxin family protein n=1 Tax=Enterococcus raffinosus TaxID=71452 RepID=UPI002891E6FF|nr:thioredoxin family protein [Enterococcus raffinosus]MDT2525142.1 thioredoxin family protein [Enterococcus raffinosus]MDT2592497.1 thioredoxin family protein [Enterococcus raffinosus]
MSNKLKSLLLCICLFIVFSLGTVATIKHYENKQTVHSYRELSKKKKSIVFYRDDCSDCQKVFPRLFLHNLFNNDIVFVNMNNKENRNLIKRFDLVEVPTTINKKQSKRYSGTNFKEIEKVIQKVGE